jgi:hypothetical protein
MIAEDYLLHTHTHILENIKLADQKATAFIAIDSAIIAALFGAKLLILNPADPWITWLSIASFTLLGVAVVLGGFVIWPRGEKIADRAEGGDLAVPSKISRLHKSPTELAAAVNSAAANATLTDQLAALVLVRSQINDKKYFWLKGSIIVSALGMVSAATFVILHSL